MRMRPNFLKIHLHNSSLIMSMKWTRIKNKPQLPKQMPKKMPLQEKISQHRMIFGIIGNTYSKDVPRAVFNFLNDIKNDKFRFVIDTELYALIRKKYKLSVSKS